MPASFGIDVELPRSRYADLTRAGLSRSSLAWPEKRIRPPSMMWARWPGPGTARRRAGSGRSDQRLGQDHHLLLAAGQGPGGSGEPLAELGNSSRTRARPDWACALVRAELVTRRCQD